MNETTTGDTEFLDRVFALAELRLSARQFVEQRVNQTRPFPSVLKTKFDSTVHLHQRVIETIETPLGTETIGWTITDLTDGDVTMKNQPSWDRTKTVTPTKICTMDCYELVTTEAGRPRFAY
jgi:hypothetical protein